MKNICQSGRKQQCWSTALTRGLALSALLVATGCMSASEQHSAMKRIGLSLASATSSITQSIKQIIAPNSTSNGDVLLCEELRGKRLPITKIGGTDALDFQACAEPTTSLESGGEGLVIFETRTIRGGSPDLASGAGIPTLIAGELALPDATTGKVPAVIYIPSRRGYNREMRARSTLYTDRGYAYFSLDIFGNRGGARYVDCQAAVIDAYKALNLLTTHPDIDPERIALAGYSCGGIAALYAALSPAYVGHGKPDTHFRAFVAGAPFCQYEVDEGVSFLPGAVFIGQGDHDYLATPEHCARFMQQARLQERSVVHRVFENASHDLGDTSPLRTSGNQIQWHNCKFKVDRRGAITDQNGKYFFETKCHGTGGYQGGSEDYWRTFDDEAFDFLYAAFSKPVS